MMLVTVAARAPVPSSSIDLACSDAYDLCWGNTPSVLSYIGYMMYEQGGSTHTQAW